MTRSPLRIWRDGVTRALRAPGLLLLLWGLTLITTAVPAWFMQDAIASHLDSSMSAARVADGVDFDWLQEFRDSGAFQRSLRLDVVGGAAVVSNTSALLDGQQRPTVVLLTGALFVLMLWLVTPGCIHRLAAGASIGRERFFATCGRLLLPLLRLNVGAALVYAALFGSLRPWLLDDMFDQVTRDLTVERTAFFIRLGGYALFLLLIGLVNLVSDVARVRMVVEGRRSAVAAAAAGLRLLARNPLAFVVPYVGNALTLGLIVGAYVVLAPGVGTAGWDMWVAFAFGQLYLLARLLIKLAFWGSEAAALQATFDAPGFVRG